MSKFIFLKSLPTILEPIKKLIDRKAQDIDWNENDSNSPSYIANRTHYKEIDTVIDLPETTVEFTNTSGIIYFGELAASVSIAENDKRIVSWDGVQYNCTATLSYGDLCLGNLNLTVSEKPNTGEPFLIIIPSDGSNLVVGSADTSATHTVSIYGEQTVIHKIPAEYLPETGVGKKGTGKNAEIFNDYGNNQAEGDYSHAEGIETIASGEAAHSEGSNTVASGGCSHTEGAETIASGIFSHAEGLSAKAKNTASHAEGHNTEASGIDSHAEGQASVASGDFSHAEGSGSKASGTYSHAEGYKTTALGETSHAEGEQTIASGKYSHAEGNGTQANAIGSHAEGYGTVASNEYSHAEGYTTTASGKWSHTEGYGTIAGAQNAHAEGQNSIACANESHAEGSSTKAYGRYSHAEGHLAVAYGLGSHAEGEGRQSSIYISGEANSTTYTYTFTSVVYPLKIGSVIYLYDNTSAAAKITAFTDSTITVSKTLSSAAITNVMACVFMGAATGALSHAEGQYTLASGQSSHAEGLETIATSNYQHVQGKYNIEDAASQYAHIIGNGSARMSNSQQIETRSNAHTVDWDGNAWYQGDVYVGGTSQDVDSKKLATEEFVNAAVANIEPPSVEGLATETYVNEQVAALVDSSPDTLNTLNELAAALGDDPNFATTVATQIGGKVDKTTTVNGKALSGNITLNASDVGALPDTTVIPSIEGLATEEYVNEAVAANKPNWNAAKGESGYIENRTHWVGENEEVLPMVELNAEGNFMYTSPLTIPIEVGQAYVVNWNGVEYKCTAKVLTAMGVSIIYLGNGASINPSLGLPVTDEPFVIVENSSGIMGDEGTLAAKPVDDSTSVNVSIHIDGKVYHTIDGNFLPEYIYGYDKAALYPVTTLTFEEGLHDYGFYEPLPFSLIEGNTYTVVLNGASFETIAKSITLDPDQGLKGMALGDISVMETGEPNGTYPFTFVELPTEISADIGAYATLICYDESLTEVSFGIYGNKIRKVPDEFLPEKTHWENKEDVELLAETIVSRVEDQPYGPLMFNKKNQLIIGETYKVIFNNEEYLCELKQIRESFAGNFTAYLGNGTLAGDTSTSEPFGIYILSNEFSQAAGGMDALALFTDGSTQGKFAIYEPAGKIHKLDAKFLPDGIATEEYVDEKIARLEIPDVSGLVTEEYVNNAIAAIPGTDLSGYYTKEQTDNQINAAKPDISGLASVSYVDTKVASLIYTAPDTLDTLYELAAALGNDPNFATTIATQIGNKVDKTTTVNGKALYSNIILTPEDIGAERAGAGAEQALARLYIKNGNSLSIRSKWSAEDDSEYNIGYHAVNLGDNSRASGSISYAEGSETTASGSCSHAEGNTTIAGDVAHAEGYKTTASGAYSHTEGYETTASGSCSHAEGNTTIAIGNNSHAEGYNTTASGIDSHAEGRVTTASGDRSHAEGHNTTASGTYSHSEGIETTASGSSSHAEGLNTIASSDNQHVQGKYNLDDTANKYAHIVGNGGADTNRSNAHTLDWSGLGWFAGGLKIGGTGQDDAAAVNVLTENDLVAITNDEIDAICGTNLYNDISENILVDIITGATYRVYVSNGELSMAEVNASSDIIQLMFVDKQTNNLYKLYVSNGTLNMMEVE